MKKIRTRKDIEKITIKQLNELISAEKALRDAQLSIKWYRQDLEKIDKERKLLSNRQQQALKNGLVSVDELRAFDEIHKRNLENRELGKDNQL